MLKFLFLSFILSTFPSFVRGQSIRPDTAFLTQAIRNCIDTHQQAFHNQPALYNGRDYLEPPRTDDQHPFFATDDWTSGSLDFMGSAYNNVPLLYDLTADKLITELHHNGTPISLPSEKVTAFFLSDHTFKWLKKDSVNQGLPVSGFYDIIYQGPSAVIVRREKNLQKPIHAGQVVIYYEEKTRYYIRNNGKYFPIKSTASILNIFQDQKRALKEYLNENRKQIKTDREAAFVMMAKFHDTLKLKNQ